MEPHLFGINLPMVTTTAFLILNIAFLPSGASGLQCFQCGLYNDGVGSITPCINYTVEKHLKECPSAAHKYCIKYVSEGSEVRECIDTCKEVENWGTRIYCCQEDGCNAGSLPPAPRLPLVLGLSLVLVALAHRLVQLPLAGAPLQQGNF